jgi:hypothetical protein
MGQPCVDLWSFIAVCAYKWHQKLKWRNREKSRSPLANINDVCSAISLDRLKSM